MVLDHVHSMPINRPVEQIFPIRSQTGCLLKWGWSTIFLHKALTNSCHRCQRHPFDINDFGSFHNTEIKLDNRRTMLQGQWPSQGCGYCEQQERSGISDRQFQLMSQRDPGLTPVELHTDAQAVTVTPTMLEIYFRNTCNQKCVYCSPNDSNLWEKELADHGDLSHFDLNLTINPKPSLDPDTYDIALVNLWAYLDKIYPNLRRFGIVGGEPFLQQTEMDQTLEFWDTHPNPDLTLYVISNLNLPEKLMQRYYQKFQALVENHKVWRVQITASLDGWGAPQEYARFGLDLDLWQKNFENLLTKHWATVSINSAVSALTIHTMPDLMAKIRYWNTLRPEGSEPIIYSFNTTAQRPVDPMIFGPGVFEESLDRTIDLMPDQTEMQKDIKKHMAAIRQKIFMQERKDHKIKKLKDFLTELDRRRSTDWRRIFPWLLDL
jgi:hypothetical protein